LPITLDEAVRGGKVRVPTVDGPVMMTLQPGTGGGTVLRLKGKGLPSTPPGDLYAVLSIVLPPADTEKATDAYREMAKTFSGFSPRRSLEA